MPQVQRHEQVESWVYDAARQHLSRRPRRGVHVSDLVTPRKGYWARVMPKEPSNRDVLYFMAGRAHEDVFVALSGLGQHHKVEGEWLGMPDDPYEPEDGIRYQIDVLTPTSGGAETPTEFKTNRRSTVIDSSRVVEEYSHYLDQLGRYAAIREKRTAYLIVLHLLARNLALAEEAEDDGDSDETGSPLETDAFAWVRRSEPVLVVYQIDWTDEELDAIRRDMATGRRLLEAAVEARDHTILPQCPPFMCGREHKRVSDPRCPACGTVYENRRLRKCKPCKTDLVKDEEIVFVPGCRWFGVCKPPQWARWHDNYFRPKTKTSPDA